MWVLVVFPKAKIQLCQWRLQISIIRCCIFVVSSIWPPNLVSFYKVVSFNIDLSLHKAINGLHKTCTTPTPLFSLTFPLPLFCKHLLPQSFFQNALHLPLPHTHSRALWTRISSLWFWCGDSHGILKYSLSRETSTASEKHKTAHCFTMENQKAFAKTGLFLELMLFFIQMLSFFLVHNATTSTSSFHQSFPPLGLSCPDQLSLHLPEYPLPKSLSLSLTNASTHTHTLQFIQAHRYCHGTVTCDWKL